MRILYLHIFCLLVMFYKAQNLVPNPSFETYTLCPNTIGQIESAIPWTAATTDVSSTDYYNGCSSSSVIDVPNNQGSGFQNAGTGNAYAGLLFYVGSSGAREYLQVQLTTPLVQNTTYYVEFFVNLYNNSSSPCNNVAANLSVNRPFTTAANNLLPLIPHIINQSNPIINDTLNWVKISGCYTAQGGEKYLTIGNFFDNANTTVTGTTGGIAYYYIDDVRVEELTGICVTGIEDQSYGSEVVGVYPNPTNGFFTVSNKYDIQKVELTTITGQLLLSEPVNQTSHQLQLQHFAEGIYFVKVIYTNGMSVTKKVVKQ